MFIHPQLDPIAIHIGPLAVHWYGLMYLLAFMLFLWLGKLRVRTLNRPGWDDKMMDDLLFYGILGVVLGGRLGEVLFYNPGYYMSHPLELGAGRIGNFINAELWGRPTNMAWGMVFPNVDDLPRHPSQLYEFALEGLALFALMWLYSRKPRPVGAVSGLFLIGYGSFRFFVEYTRNPDDGIFGLMSFGISMGQWLSLPMVIVGLMLMIWGQQKSATPK
ncbi:MAG: prolipoprotein diacylglyceryl transferase [Proteobacteria bacterium]|nr:prolipoprotein diacylglyceryl transferase [Pseudomonadota bacterium]